jgi:hypothetical protein
MDAVVQPPSFHTERLLSRLRAFSFPAGEPSAAFIHAVNITATGQLRMSLVRIAHALSASWCFPTEWSATGWDFRNCEGMRVPRQLKAAWHLPGGVFPYFNVVPGYALTAIRATP